MEHRDVARALLAHVYRGRTTWGRLKGRRYEDNCEFVRANEWLVAFAAKKRPPPGWFRRIRKRYFGIFKDVDGRFWIEFRNSPRLPDARCLGIARLATESAEESVEKIKGILKRKSSETVTLDIDRRLDIPEDDAVMEDYLRGHRYDGDGFAEPPYDEARSYTAYEDATDNDEDDDWSSVSEDDSMPNSEFEALTLFQLTKVPAIDWAPYVPFDE